METGGAQRPRVTGRPVGWLAGWSPGQVGTVGTWHFMGTDEFGFLCALASRNNNKWQPREPSRLICPTARRGFLEACTYDTVRAYLMYSVPFLALSPFDVVPICFSILSTSLVSGLPVKPSDSRIKAILLARLRPSRRLLLADWLPVRGFPLVSWSGVLV